MSSYHWRRGEAPSKPVQRNEQKEAETARCIAAFRETAGQEACEIVSELTFRHWPRDSRQPCDDAFADIIAEKWSPYKVNSRDIYGEHKVGELAAILKQKQILFEDPFFPAHDVSIYADPAKADANADVAQTLRKDQDLFLAGVKGIEWKRPCDIGDPTWECRMFSGLAADADAAGGKYQHALEKGMLDKHLHDLGIDPDDVAQGQIGNCYFMAAIANTAGATKDVIIRDLVVEDYGKQGLYGVKFFINGQWNTVLVDDRLPCIFEGSQWKPIFAGLKGHSKQKDKVKELWPMIFEKAWSKLHMSYEATAAGDTADATNYLTGGFITKIEIESPSLADVHYAQDRWEELFKIMNPANDDARVFCSCNARYDANEKDLADKGLVSGHAYSILKMKKSTINNVCFIQLRNPWGQCEWLGDWRDQDPRWTEELKTEMEHDIEPDGTFCMAWNDFVVWFGEVQISDPVCLQHATEGDTAQVDVFHSAMVAGKTAGGPRGGRTFHFNPSVGLTVTKDCDVYLSLYQPDTRSYGQDEDGYQLDGQQLALTLTDPIHTHVQTEVMHLSPYERLTCCKIKCDAGKTYKLTVSSWAAGVECPFWVTAAGYGCHLVGVQQEEPSAAGAEHMKRRENQKFGCVECLKPFCAAPYYPMPEGPTCVACKVKKAPKCYFCQHSITGLSYEHGVEIICQACFFQSERNDDGQHRQRTKSKPVFHATRQVVTDRCLVTFIETAGQEACEIVSELTFRHWPRDSRQPCDDAFADIIAEKWSPYKVNSRDIYGEHKVGELAAILKQKQILFEDPFFPAHDVSIYADPAKADANADVAQTLRKDQDLFLAGVKGIEWKRPCDIGDPTWECRMFSGLAADADAAGGKYQHALEKGMLDKHLHDLGIDPDDVAQGQIGNCYFMAAIANTAGATKDVIIRDLVVEDYGKQGLYGVKFFINGQWNTVLVDDRLPCIFEGSQWKPIFAGLKGHSKQKDKVKELWPMIFEKAWSKLHMSYEATAAGDTADATNYLTGGFITKIEIESPSLADVHYAQDRWEELFKIMNPANDDARVFCSCNARYDANEKDLADKGLVSGHAYSILKMKKSTINNVCFIQLRNPWGQCEWLGDWRDQDPRWTEELKTEMEHDIEPDGTFCMAWNDFVVWFGEVQISDPVCLQHATEGDTAQVDVFHSAMVAGKTAGGPRGGRTFHFNPSVGLTVTKDCDVYLSLYQPDTRSYGQDEDGYQLDGQQLALTLTDPIHTHVQTEVMHLSPYERLTCCKIKCDAGKTYKLTVSSWAAGVECPFWVTAAGYGCHLVGVQQEEPSAAGAEHMKRRENQKFGCVECLKPFCAAPYYPMPDGPICEACKGKNDPKCKECLQTPPGVFYRRVDHDATTPTSQFIIICQACFEEKEGNAGRSTL